MNSLLLAAMCFVAYIVGYFTYGKYIGQRIFKLDPAAKVPSSELRDDVDYIPTKKEILFGDIISPPLLASRRLWGRP